MPDSKFPTNYSVPAMIFRTTSVLLYPLVASAFALAQETPVVIWCSSPVQPGQTVLVHGGQFGSRPVVELTPGQSPDGGQQRTVEPLRVSESALLFVLPKDWQPGIVCAAIRADSAGGPKGKPFLINQPNVFWVQGDRGREASTGTGVVRLFGNCLTLTPADKPEVVLRDGQGTPFPAKVDVASPFAVAASWNKANGPAAGDYEILFRRNAGEQPMVAGRIRISEPVAAYPQEVFNVVDCGAIANDGIDDTDAILAAVERLTANGGGTLLFPRGRFQMTATIELPPRSILRGEGANLSQVYWPDTYEPVEALVKGAHSFEVADIFLACGFHQDGIVGNPAVPKEPLDDAAAANYRSGNITVRNVTLRMIYSQYVNADMEELKRRLTLLHYTRALRFGGENINVIGNDIYCAAGGVFELRAYWSRVADNRFCRGNIVGWNGFSGQQLIVEDNHLGGANCTSFYGLPEGSENIYWANNLHENNFDGNNRETITGDGRVHGYMDTVENITPDAFTLKPNVPLARGVPAWRNGAVQIAGGKGVGQLRRIRSIEGGRVGLAEPWDIVPDATSVINISSFRRRFIYTQNRAYDSSVALQLYGSMIEGIMADNETARTGGYNGDAMAGEANWFNQFLRNRITVGNQYRGPRNEVPPSDAQLGLLAYGSGTGDYKYPLVRSCVVRNNRLESNAKLNVMGWVEDALLEGNEVCNADTGVTISAAARNIILRNNTFENVVRRYAFEPDSAALPPAEDLLAGLGDVRTALSPAETAAWQPVAGSESLPDASPEQIEALRHKAIRELAAVLKGRPVPLEALQQLLGLNVLTPNWQTAYPVLRDGQAGTRPLMVRAVNSQVAAHLTLSIRPEDLPGPGWTFEIPEFDLQPGTTVDGNGQITKPAGAARLVRFPLLGKLSGDGWELLFHTTVFDPYDQIALSAFRVSRPLPNPCVKGTLGYIPYSQIPRPAEDQLVEAPTEFGRFAFASLYRGGGADKAHLDGAVLYGKTVLQAREPVKIKLLFSNQCLVFINGKILGTTLGRGQWGFANLQEGDNLIELIMMPSARDEYRFGLPRIVWASRPTALAVPENKF